jgi:sugar/nucleoside kinase (ribokinase family)
MNTKNVVAGMGMTITDVLMSADTVTWQTKNPVSHQSVQLGGVVPSALTVLTRLGVPTKLYSMVGKDMFGDVMLEKLKEEHIDVTHIIQDPDVTTPLACVILHNSDQRTIFYTSDSFATWHQPGLSRSLPKDTYLLADGHNVGLTMEFLETAKKQNTRVILDLGNPKEGLEQMIPEAYGIIIPQAYWKAIHDKEPDAIVAEYLTKGPSLVILTMGEGGCIVGTPEETFHQASWKVNAIDTNGAGDVFFGAFTYGLINQWPIHQIAEFACAAGARSTTIVGKQNKIPHSEAEIREFITSQK